MRRLTIRLAATAAALAAATAVVGAPTATAAGPAAEVACNSFTNVGVGGGWYLHVPSVGANSGVYNCVVVRGHRGIAVLVVQESLNACYQQGLQEDSDFGGNTERGVKNAQTAINRAYGNVLTVDGRFGPKTSSYFSFQAYDYNNGAGGAHTGFCYRR
ncbi:peptidoglycan-binding domain-containing protein [Amycolatopsis kentuckyensis]|uniref:peptidoglycan-binding domain-containing protein n=1 Tax=Amycolatopsis kentuckyensis TaxID=218823 RepID=UPI000A3695DA|nr:peptidoglycan-binding protein [Amycolatopsis kentuckyensis]